METPEQLASVFSGNNILVALAVLIGICFLINTLGKTLETLKKFKEPKIAENDKVYEYLKQDKLRLDQHENRLSNLEHKTEDMHEGQRNLLSGVMALLDHELHNGNETQMKKASEGINEYLRNR